ncbi:MAG: hypothetical protein RBR08_12010 [Desulforegulaceae bacterium]|nr:hypothetical protein [Desulforegulaceae bacterium]
MLKKQIKCFFVGGFLFFYLSFAVIANPQKPHYQDGTNKASEIAAPMNNPQGLNETIFQPMLSDEKNMKSFGGTAQNPAVEFSANISPIATKSFLHIFIQPSPTKDIQHLAVKLDTTMDGNYDKAYTVSDTISGLCSNGFIKCSPGTWNNCSFFRWEADENLNIYGVNVGSFPSVVGRHNIPLDQKVSNCFCINNSCSGNISWQNKQNLLQTIGNGILEALNKKTSKFSVTNSVSDEFSIEYMGVKTTHTVEQSGTAISEYTSGPSNPEKYYQNNLQGAGEDEMVRQSQNTKSPYHRSYSAMANVTHPKMTVGCVEKTTIEFSGSTPYAKRTENCSELDVTNCSPYSITICNYFNGDCIDMLQYGKPTGFNPIPSTIDYNNWNFTANGSQIIAEDFNDLEPGEYPTPTPILSGPDLWWNVQREYQCRTAPHDFSGANQTEHEVDTSLKMVGTESFSYGHRGISYSGQMPYTERPDQTCDPVCKVRLTVAHSAVASDGSGVWDGNTNNFSDEDFYKTCIANQCPLDTGESLILDCGCHNAFAEAMSAVAIIEAMSKDFICSSN